MPPDFRAMGPSVKAALLGTFLLALAGIPRAQGPLLVCLPGGLPASRIESALGPSLAPRKVIAFLRVRDLEDVLPSYPKSSVVTTSAYASYLTGYAIQLKGRRRDAHGKFLVVSADSALGSSGLASKRIGILDFLGRDKIPLFVEEAFGWKPSALKRVNKQEDLMSLLGMEAVDAIIVESGVWSDLKMDTRLRLHVVMESKPVSMVPVLAVPPDGDAGARDALLRQPKAVLDLLGVERWE